MRGISRPSWTSLVKAPVDKVREEFRRSGDRYSTIDWNNPKSYAYALYNPGALVQQAFSRPGFVDDLPNGLRNTLAPFTMAMPSKDGTGDPSAGNPPTIDESNDPNLAAQFKRMRAAARALGRAGTIKSKGYSTLGGDTSSGGLGTDLSLQGS